MRGLILDGWHKGTLLDLHEPMQTIRLPRPTVVTDCLCDPDEIEVSRVGPAIHEYRVAFRPLDGALWLYTESGGSDLESIHYRDYLIVPTFRQPDPIYVGCRDHRAWGQESRRAAVLDDTQEQTR